MTRIRSRRERPAIGVPLPRCFSRCLRSRRPTGVPASRTSGRFLAHFIATEVTQNGPLDARLSLPTVGPVLTQRGAWTNKTCLETPSTDTSVFGTSAPLDLRGRGERNAIGSSLYRACSVEPLGGLPAGRFRAQPRGCGRSRSGQAVPKSHRGHD